MFSCVLNACGSSDSNSVGSDGDENAGSKLTSPDLNRDPNSPRPMPDPNTRYPIAKFFDQLLREGSSYKLVGQFKSGDNVTEEEHSQSRAPMSRAPWPWRGKGDLLRTLVTVDRISDGRPGKTDVYAGYFDINGAYIGQRIKGETAIELANGLWVRPEFVRVGEVGNIGRVDTFSDPDKAATGYRDTRWEMLMLSDGSPAYCERTEEFDTADRSVWAFEWCRGISAGGKPTERITYSYEFGQNTGNIVGTNFKFGPAESSVAEPADGQPFTPPPQARPQLTELDCVYIDTAAAVRTHQRRNFVVNAALGELQNGQSQLLANFFRWDAWQKEYVTWSRSDQGLGNFEQFARYDAELNATLYTSKTTEQDENFVSTSCFSGVVARPRVSPDGNESTLSCEREDLRSGAITQGSAQVRMNNGWINTEFSRSIGVSPSERFDAIQFSETLPTSSTDKSFERLPDGWIHYREQNGRTDGAAGQEWAREDHFEFNAVGQFRSYNRVVQGIERLNCTT
jgi:hypothetical protein